MSCSVESQNLSIPVQGGLGIPTLHCEKHYSFFFKETGNQRGSVMGLRPHSWRSKSWGLNVGLSGPEAQDGIIANLLSSLSKRTKTQCLATEDPQSLRR